MMRAMKRRFHRVSFVVVAAFALAGCAGEASAPEASRTPTETVEAYMDALGSSRWEEACSLMVPSQNDGDFEAGSCVEAVQEKHAAEVVRKYRIVDAPEGGGTQVDVGIRKNGSDVIENLSVVKEGDTWYMRGIGNFP